MPGASITPGVIPVPACAGMSSAGIQRLFVAETLGPRLRGDDELENARLRKPR
jgi:hypothetical protein